MHSPRLLTLATMATSALALAGCNPFHRAARPAPAVEVSRDANVNARWRGALVTPATLAGAVQMNGAATMAPGANRAGTRLTLEVANATPGGLHPWQVHRGQCGADEGVFGASEAYAPIAVNAQGKASGSASLPLETPTAGSYFVSVGASAANPETIVACGNLAPPTQ
jgi:hypothetical protein